MNCYSCSCFCWYPHKLISSFIFYYYSIFYFCTTIFCYLKSFWDDYIIV